MKIALLEVSHWHFPLFIDALQAAPVEIAALSERDEAIRRREAARFGARAYADPLALIAAEPIDFAFVFGRHAEMPAIAAALIARDIPFAIEKPGGLHAGDVARLRRAAAARGLPVAVPFIQRLGPVGTVARRLIEQEGAAFTGASWRFLAGPPTRYLPTGSGWLLDPAKSGGGCMMNLAGHFIDLSLWLLGGPVDSVFARTDRALHGGTVEDHALLSMRHENGGMTTVETGYCFPDHPAKREFSFTLIGRAHYLCGQADGIRIHRAGRREVEHVALTLDTDPLYAGFVRQTLAGRAAGTPPPTGLAELEATMRIMDAAYRSATLETAIRPVA